MKRLSFALVFCLLSFFAFAQDEDSRSYEDNPSLWDKITVGGNFGLQFGTVTYIDISPMVGYRFTDRFTAGPGFTYRYLKVRGFEGSSIYGGSAFARYLIGSQFFVQSQYESLNTPYYPGNGEERRDWVSGFFVGGGLYQSLGRRGAVLLSAMYNLMYDNVRSPYNSPWVLNVGFTL
jgi:hypothetical protein